MAKPTLDPSQFLSMTPKQPEETGVPQRTPVVAPEPARKVGRPAKIAAERPNEKRMSFGLDAETWGQFRVMLFELGITSQDALEEMVKEAIRKRSIK